MHILVPEREGGLEEFEEPPGTELAGVEAVAIDATEVGETMSLAGGATATEVVAGVDALEDTVAGFDVVAGAGACVSVDATEAGGFAAGALAMLDNEFGTAGRKAEGPEPQNVTSKLMLSNWQAR